MKKPVDEVSEHVRALVARRLVRYVRPKIRSIKVPLIQTTSTPWSDCVPFGCAPPGPCGPGRK